MVVLNVLRRTWRFVAYPGLDSSLKPVRTVFCNRLMDAVKLLQKKTLCRAAADNRL